MPATSVKPSRGRGPNDRGLTIIETTVMLSVLFILAGMLSPIMADMVTMARAVKAKNDAAMIATGLVNLQKDLGADALSFGLAGRAARFSRLPDVLMSEGTPPRTEDPNNEEAASLDAVVEGAALLGRPSAQLTMRALRSKWFEVTSELLDDHLVTNRRGYRLRTPGEYGGWNGPYLSAKLNGDPWGNRYVINSCWLDGGSTAADGTGAVRRAVYVVSAGANGVIETPFEQPITDARAYGDDIVIRVQ